MLKLVLLLQLINAQIIFAIFPQFMINFKKFCQLAHLQIPIPNAVSKWIIIVEGLQYLSFMIPLDNWGLWVHVDRNLQLIQTIANFTVLTPMIQDSHKASLAFAASFISLLLMIGTICYVFLSLQSDKLGKCCLLLILTFQGLFQLPLISLLISQLFCSENSLKLYCTFDAQTFINLFALALLFFIIVVSEYFCCSYQFSPLVNLQTRFSHVQFLILFFNTLIIFFQLFEASETLNYIKLTLLNICFLFNIRLYYLHRPLIPELNQLKFKLSIILETICVLVTINIVSSNRIFNERNLLVLLMLAGSLVFYFSSVLYDSALSVNKLSYTQYLNGLLLDKSPSSKFQYKQLLLSHIKTCTSDCYSTANSGPKQKKTVRQVIYCILNSCIQEKQHDLEEVKLFQINFLATLCKKPLLAYAELKKYEQMQRYSYYYSQVKYQIAFCIEQMIVNMQRKMDKLNIKSAQPERQLLVHQIIKAVYLQDEYIRRFVDVLEQKISLWNNQIKGYNSIYDLKSQILALSSSISQLKADLTKELEIDISNIEHLTLNFDVVQIKFASIFASAIMNDFYGSFICEQTINEILQIERTFAGDVISNYKLMEDKVAIMNVSMVKKRGQILNKRNYAEFFGYSEEQYSAVSQINQLMPMFIHSIHDILLQDYMQTGLSQLFSDYNNVFSIDGEGFLRAQQLKIDNDFSQHDDYVLIGCISQIKTTLDHIIFGEDGRIFGMTKDLFTNAIKSSDPNASMKVLCGAYIFQLLPTIMAIIREFHMRSRTDYSNELRDQAVLICPTDLKQLSLRFQEYFLTAKRVSSQYIQSLSQVQQDTEQKNYSQLGSGSESQNTIYNHSQSDRQYLLAKEHYQELVEKFISSVDSTNFKRFMIKFILTQRTIGKRNTKVTFYVLEIHELVRKDLFSKGESGYRSNPSANVSIMNTKHPSSYQSSTSQSQNSAIAVRESLNYFQQPNESIINPSKQIYQFKQSSQINMNQTIGMDSARDSISYGPLSQRINFISPTSKQVQLEDLIEQELRELEEQVDQEQKNEFQFLENQSSSKNRHFSDSKQESNKVLQLLRFNRTKGMNEQENLEFDAQKSKSSGTSGTSGTNAMQIIKRFQQNKSMIKSLRVIFSINFLCLVIYVVYISTSCVIIKNNDDQIYRMLEQFNAPMYYSRYFCRIFAFAWNLLFNSYDVLHSSQYLVTSILEGLRTAYSTVFIQFSEMYDTFLDIEESGYLKPIMLDLVFQPEETTTYTHFTQYIQQILQTLLKAKDLRIDQLSLLRNTEFINSLLIMRFNLKNIIILNVELIDSLDLLFYKHLDELILQYEIVVLVEIFVLLIIFLIQIFYWRAVEVYSQQLLLLIGRKQESNTEDQILRANVIKESLKAEFAIKSWKKQNFHQLQFQGIEKRSAESSQKFKQPTSGSNKRLTTSTQILSSRILQTETSLIKTVISVVLTAIALALYLLGGFLMFNSQTYNLKPSQQLALEFIQFSSQFDIVASTGMIIKTQEILYKEFEDHATFTPETVNQFRNHPSSMLDNFIRLEKNFDMNLTLMFENIQKSSRIGEQEKRVLTSLFKDDLCQYLKADIKFCNFDENFIEKYGNFSSFDDNRDYLRQGIVGVASRFHVIVNQIFVNELTTKQYPKNVDELLEQVVTKEFNNIFFQHFIDTTDATRYALDIIGTSIKAIMDSDLSDIYLYFIMGGSFILLLYSTIYAYWIYKTNLCLIYLRLALVTLPIEILTDQHTVSVLRRMT